MFCLSSKHKNCYIVSKFCVPLGIKVCFSLGYFKIKKRSLSKAIYFSLKLYIFLDHNHENPESSLRTYCWKLESFSKMNDIDMPLNDKIP